MNRVIRVIFFLAMVWIYAMASGCAFGDRRVTLSYPPEKGAEKSGSGVAEAAPLSTATGKTIYLRKFDDQRTKQEIGEVRNGWGAKTADVIAENDVRKWISEALKTELEEAGYNVITNAGGDVPSAEPELGGEILTVYCTALMSYEGEVSFFAYVTKEDKELLRKRYTGKGSAGTNWGASAKSYGQSLSMALSEAIKSLLNDLDDALSQD